MIEPVSDAAEDVADAELCQTFFDRDSIENELYDLLDAIGKGYSVAEIIWDMSESQWMPDRLEWRLPQWSTSTAPAGAGCCCAPTRRLGGAAAT